ncbi:MAG TPA: 6-phosphogluconolactonase [Candidatus Saccharimonadales bacterium]|nr:6-phosphogluconolactonase [Candidatus Saccharimonadales bacterium]
MNKFEFKKILSTEPVYNYVLKSIEEHLENGAKVLWLLSGGSAIPIEIEVSKKLKDNHKTDNLTALLIDERYGDAGHKDSNYEQLKSSGFDLPLKPILENKGLEQTVNDYQSELSSLLDQTDFVIALAGLGPDGHTFGIKPHSPSVETERLVIGYEWDDYVRITTTAKLIERIDLLIVYAAGLEKREQLTKLKSNLPAAEQPAQLLKLGKEVIIFNDQIDE